jgi:ribosomal protein S24E
MVTMSTEEMVSDIEGIGKALKNLPEEVVIDVIENENGTQETVGKTITYENGTKEIVNKTGRYKITSNDNP